MTDLPHSLNSDTGLPHPAIYPALRRVGLALLISAAGMASVAAGYRLSEQPGAYVSTDDAYLRGDVTFVSPKVSGYVTEILTENDQTVAPGAPLLRIDPTDYRSTVADAKASVEQQEAAIRQLTAQRGLQQVQIRIADAGVLAARATITKTSADHHRTTALQGDGFASQKLVDQTLADNIHAEASLEQAAAQADFARQQLVVIDAQLDSAHALLTGAQAKLVRAEADLDRTTILAPREGRIAARNVRVGEFVSTGTRLLAVTPTKGLWVEANLRETQLGYIHAGDRVQLRVDAVPDVLFCGTLDGVQGASGSDFAVLPPDNATGNFTKIVRRFTARITLDPNQNGLDRIASGMSAVPVIAVGSHVDGQPHAGFLSRQIYGSFSCGS